MSTAPACPVCGRPGGPTGAKGFWACSWCECEFKGKG
jgi:ribosomal protein L37AE/L43A